MRPSAVVTLLTDFGVKDGYVAAMKGVLLSLVPAVVIVDISHEVRRHDVLGGAYVLASAAPYFPCGTVHVAVVDPGVGSSRAALAVQTKEAWFVGPDNGVLYRAAQRQVEACRSIDSVPGFSGARSATFHGRDLFAPAAAHLAIGRPISELGSTLGQLTPFKVPEATVEGDTVAGEVVHIDGFGNVITNIERSLIDRSVAVEVGEVIIDGLVECYADVAAGTLCALIGSDGTLEVALSEGAAALRLGLDRGDRVVCHLR